MEVTINEQPSAESLVRPLAALDVQDDFLAALSPVVQALDHAVSTSLDGWFCLKLKLETRTLFQQRERFEEELKKSQHGTLVWAIEWYSPVTCVIRANPGRAHRAAESGFTANVVLELLNTHGWSKARAIGDQNAPILMSYGGELCLDGHGWSGKDLGWHEIVFGIVVASVGQTKEDLLDKLKALFNRSKSSLRIIFLIDLNIVESDDPTSFSFDGELRIKGDGPNAHSRIAPGQHRTCHYSTKEGDVPLSIPIVVPSEHFPVGEAHELRIDLAEAVKETVVEMKAYHQERLSMREAREARSDFLAALAPVVEALDHAISTSPDGWFCLKLELETRTLFYQRERFEEELKRSQHGALVRAIEWYSPVTCVITANPCRAHRAAESTLSFDISLELLNTHGWSRRGAGGSQNPAIPMWHGGELLLDGRGWSGKDGGQHEILFGIEVASVGQTKEKLLDKLEALFNRSKSSLRIIFLIDLNIHESDDPTTFSFDGELRIKGDGPNAHSRIAPGQHHTCHYSSREGDVPLSIPIVVPSEYFPVGEGQELRIDLAGTVKETIAEMKEYDQERVRKMEERDASRRAT